MDEIILNIFTIINIKVETIKELKWQLIERDIFLDNKKYELLLPEIKKLKNYLSSSAMTALQDTAKINKSNHCLIQYVNFLKYII